MVMNFFFLQINSECFWCISCIESYRSKSKGISYLVSRFIFRIGTIFLRYIENVFPGEFGLPKPFYFFLEPSYWRGTSNDRPGYERLMDMNGNKLRGPNFEDEPEGEIGVSIQDLRKVYNVWSIDSHIYVLCLLF